MTVKIFTEHEADIDMGIEECVYKLWYGQKYIIWYGMTLYGSFFHKKIYQYMYDHRRLDLRVEILLESDNHYQILKQQQLMLNDAKKDKNCLNGLFWSYIPVFSKAKWEWGNFKKAAVLNYFKLIQSERYLKQVTGY